MNAECSKVSRPSTSDAANHFIFDTNANNSAIYWTWTRTNMHRRHTVSDRTNRITSVFANLENHPDYL